MEYPLDSDEAKIWLMFLRAHASLMRKMETELQQQTGMSLKWMDVLVQLSLEAGHRMTHTRLSQRRLVSQGGLTRLVDRMAKAGLVRRQRSRKDRRTSYVVLTDEGAKALETMYPVQYQNILDMFVSQLDDENTPVIRDFFEGVLGERP